mgnify:CR=1 FL=1
MLPIHHLSFKVSWFVVYIGDSDRVGLVISHIKNFFPFVTDNNSILYQMNICLIVWKLFIIIPFWSSIYSAKFRSLSFFYADPTT